MASLGSWLLLQQRPEQRGAYERAYGSLPYMCVRCFHGCSLAARFAPCLRLCEPRGREGHGRGPGGRLHMLHSQFYFYFILCWLLV